MPLLFLFGAGDRTRTGTLSLAVDFESTTSTNSITPAGVVKLYYAGRFGLLRCLTSSSATERLPLLSTAATRSARCICHWQRSHRSPSHRQVRIL